MNLFTIGFTGKSAQSFFGLLAESNASQLLDIRINRTSQLAGFAKEQDLKFFIPTLAEMKYVVREEFAPTKDLLTAYRKKDIDWTTFAQKYVELIEGRDVLREITEVDFENSVILCSENEPENCHRSLLASLIAQKLPNINIINLV